MIPSEIIHYLQHHEIPFSRHWHPRAVAAQRLAHSLHVSGKQVAKCVIVEADGADWIAVLPANRRLDLDRLRNLLGARNVRLVPESAFGDLFPGCEVGAEPPFGRLYGL